MPSETYEQPCPDCGGYLTELGEGARCLDCDETFSHKVRASDHARQHMPAVGTHGLYDYMELVPRGGRSE